MDIHDSHASFMDKVSSGYPLQDASYYYVDEFSAVMCSPKGPEAHAVEAISKSTGKTCLRFLVSSKQEAFSWMDKLYEIIESYMDETANQTYSCLDSKVKVDKTGL